jgi:hypothetical protein
MTLKEAVMALQSKFSLLIAPRINIIVFLLSYGATYYASSYDSFYQRIVKYHE